jgi:hypothetical protein
MRNLVGDKNKIPANIGTFENEKKPLQEGPAPRARYSSPWVDTPLTSLHRAIEQIPRLEEATKSQNVDISFDLIVAQLLSPPGWRSSRCDRTG